MVHGRNFHESPVGNRRHSRLTVSATGVPGAFSLGEPEFIGEGADGHMRGAYAPRKGFRRRNFKTPVVRRRLMVTTCASSIHFEWSLELTFAVGDGDRKMDR